MKKKKKKVSSLISLLSTCYMNAVIFITAFGHHLLTHLISSW